MRLSLATLVAATAILVLTWQPGASAQAATACPPMPCSAGYGEGVCSSGVAGALVEEGAGWVGMVTSLQTGADVTGPESCCEGCAAEPGCAYWTFALLDDLTPACHFYRSEACDSGSNFIPDLTPAQLALGQSFTTGALCKSAPSVVGDPHYTGADNSHFDFTGLPGKSYCLLSDAHLHINVFHDGRFDQWGKNPSKPLTWIRQVSIFWGHHIVQLMARTGPTWEYGTGYMKSIFVDTYSVSLMPGDKFGFADDQIEIQWVAARQKSGDDEIDVYEVKISNVLRMVLRIRPEIALLRTPEDGVVHFGIEIPEVAVSPRVHGVLGQTFRDDHKNRLALQNLEYSKLLKVKVIPGENAEGFLDGDAKSYETKSVFTTDCAYSRFARSENLDTETALAIEMSRSKANAGVFPRKMGLNELELKVNNRGNNAKI